MTVIDFKKLGKVVNFLETAIIPVLFLYFSEFLVWWAALTAALALSLVPSIILFFLKIASSTVGWGASWTEDSGYFVFRLWRSK